MTMLLLLLQLVAHPPPATPMLVAMSVTMKTTYVRWTQAAPSYQEAQTYVYRVSVPTMEVDGKPVRSQLLNVGCEKPQQPMTPPPLAPGTFRCFAVMPQLTTVPGRYQIVITAAYSLHEQESPPSTAIVWEVTEKK